MNPYLSRKIKYLSFLSIIGVVFCHAYNWQDRFLQPDTVLSEGLTPGPMLQFFISNALVRFAVPLFFLFSGYLFFYHFPFTWKGYFKKVGKRVRTLVVPFLIWTALAGGLLYAVCQVVGLDRYSIVHEKVGMLLDYGIGSWFFSPPAFQLWYMADLFKLAIVSPVIYFLVKKTRLFAVGVFGILWLLGIAGMINEEGLLFFTAGAYLAVHEITIRGMGQVAETVEDPDKYRRNTWLFTILWVTGCLVYTLLSASMGGVSFIGIVLWYLYKVNVIMGLLSVWRLYDLFADKWQENSRADSVVSLTVFVYVAHEPVQHLLMDVLLEKMDFNGAHTLIYFLLAAAVISLLVLLGSFLKSLCPKVYGILVGGR